MKTKTKLLDKIFYLYLFVLALINILDVSSVSAQRVYPRSVLETGTIIDNGINNSSGYRIERDDEQRIIQSGQIYIRVWFINYTNGKLYRVCQNFRYNYPISQPYWCP